MSTEATPETRLPRSFEARQAMFKTLLDELQAVLPQPDTQLLRTAEALKNYTKDASPYASELPTAAVIPHTTEEVAAVVKLCAAHKMPMTPRGAGTGLEGGAVPHAGGIVIDTAGLQRIEFDEGNSFVWVGAGVRKMTLNKEAEKRGLLFGPDPASNPCVGGMVSTSGSGMSTLRYGTSRENVLSLRVVTPQGKIVKTRQTVRKSSTGLDLTQLFIGSEGTLVVVCEICFRLFPLTKYSAGGYAAFDELADAVKSVVALKQRGVPGTLLRCELMNKDTITVTNAYCKVSLLPITTVLLEFTGNDESMKDIHQDYEAVAKIFREVGNVRQMRYLKPGKETSDTWYARRACYYAIMHWRGKLENLLTTDICVPLTKLTEMVTFSEQLFRKTNRPFFICAHISDGNYHVDLPYRDNKELAELMDLEHVMIRRAIELGGTVSGEHGIGIGKIPHLIPEHGEEHIKLQETIKKAIDKDNLMNPGVFYPFQQKLYPKPHM